MRLSPLLLVLIGTVWAEDPIPDSSKIWTLSPISSGTGNGSVEVGAIQRWSRTSYDEAGDQSDREGDARTTTGYTTVTVGLSPTVDVLVTGGYSRCADEADGREAAGGWTDPVARVVWQAGSWYDDTLIIGLLPAVSAPYGSKANEDHLGAGSDLWQLEAAAAVCWTIGTVILQADVGVATYRQRTPDDPLGHDYVDVAAGWQVTGWIQPEIELGYQRFQSDSGPASRTVTATLGAILSPAEGWTILAGWRHDVAGRLADDGDQVQGSLIRSW